MEETRAQDLQEKNMTEEVQPMVLTTMPTIPVATRCNRCRRRLKIESSVIRGIGPVCAKRGLKSLGDLVTKDLENQEYNAVLSAFENVVIMLKQDEATLDHETLYRSRFSDLFKTKAGRVEVLEVVYSVLGDTCNQLTENVAVAFVIENLFIQLGARDEGEKARKRLIKLAQKVGKL
jgi:hypothetical protein